MIRTSALRRHAAPVLALVVLVSGCASEASEPPQADRPPMARFTDPDRRAKLERAFPVIDSLVRAFAERSRVPGVAYGVLIDGQLVHTGTAGLREIASRAPVDTTTVFRIASMTKSFTALAILRLRDEGKLSLDDPAERYVPELAQLQYPTTDAPRITIRHLLSHATGFPEDNPWGDRQLDVSDDEMGQMMRSGIPFSNPPGMAYEYSNYGFAILGRIVANVSRTPYADYVTANILRPLGMAATTLEPGAVPDDKLAHGYRWEDEQWKEEPPLPDGAFGSMGGMLTSIQDLGRYVGFLMSAWPPRDGPETGPVRRASVREMQQLWRARPARVTRAPRDSTIQLNAGGYGYGLRIGQSCAFEHIVAHTGGLPGFGSIMQWLPEHGVGFIAFGTLTYTSWGGVANQVFDALARTGGLQPREPRPSPALVDAREQVTRLINSWSDALADSLAAENLYLDEARERRRAALDRIRAQTGPCHNEGPMLAENALRGEWMMQCDRGALRVAITLAPIVPPAVQSLRVERVERVVPLQRPRSCP